MTTLSRRTPRQPGPAERRFNDAVSAEMAMGVPKDSATARIVASQPALHQAMLAEANENRRGGPRSDQRQQAARQPRSQAGPATAAWNQAIADRVKAGDSPAVALRQTVLTQPGLHRQYLAEINKR